jgi:hypothetical protein
MNFFRLHPSAFILLKRSDKMSLDIINEQSTAYLSVSFYDKSGVLAIPTSASYRIDCITNGVEVKDDTALTPGTTIEITLSSYDNEIIDGDNATEKRRVTVSAVYGDGDECHNHYDYLVKNLSGLPAPPEV